MVKYKSELEKEIAKKKELGEAEEYVKQIEDSSEEVGRKYVIDTLQAEEKIAKTKIDDVLTSLETKKSQHFSYRRSLADYGNWMLEEIKEKGWELEFVPTDGSWINIFGKGIQSKEGIILVIKNPSGRFGVRGFRTTYIPEWDENAIRMFFVQAENTMDSYKGILLSDK